MIRKLVLLPGMDRTGDLFPDFAKALPDTFETVVRYPKDECLSYAELMKFVESAAPISDPFVLVAESFSTPLAIQYAATNPPNLRGLILCAGFATSPIRGWRRFLAQLIAPVAFRLPLPKTAIACFLIGPNASESLHATVRAAIRAVKPTILAARLRQILAADVRVALGNVSVPILYIKAQQDRLVGESFLEEIQKIKPQVEIAQIRGPHFILQREPQQSADIVVSFINSLQPNCHLKTYN
jgi:pimeloyl-ACP methyl ester carboxylesterase